MEKRTILTPARNIAIIREKTEGLNIAIIIQVAKEKYPEDRPRIITDNARQFIAKNFKEFVCMSGITHFRTSTYHTSR
jgi:transposase InsO family protein